MAERTDIAIIGAGVVGLAIAAELSRTSRIVIIERHESYGRETSSHNSGVVHAGIYYPPDWLKTRLCIEGNVLLYEWAGKASVRALRVGKLIITTEESELPTLERLLSEAHANGVPDLRMLTRGEVQQLEPSIRAVAAIHSGSSGVIDQMEIMRSLLSAAEANGALAAFKHTVSAVERNTDGFELAIVDPAGQTSTLEAPVLINSAGLAADRVAAMLGYPLDGEGSVPRLRQTINKGRYYDIVNAAKARQLTHLIYPLPHTSRSGLGVHVTLDVDGGVHLGPDTEWLAADAPLDYRADDSRRRQFVESAQTYLPWLTADDVLPGHVGYRPKLHDPDGGPADFLIWHDRGYVHLGGIESPGMTASLAIARHVAQMLRP
jgi:L-2-hydroxyglutarate oxidase LhgO